MDEAMWRACAGRYLLPHLPGNWSITGDLLHLREKNEWIVCGLHPNHYEGANWFKVERLVQFLARPSTYRYGPPYDSLRHRESGGLPTLPGSVDEAGPVMQEILESIRAEVLPFFDQLKTVDGYLRWVEQYSDNSPDDSNFLELLFYAQLIHGQVHEAQHTAARILQLPEQYDPGWFMALTGRVRRVSELAAKDVPSAQSLLREWATDTWREISKTGS